MTHDPLPPLTPEEGGLHGEIPDTPEMRAWFQGLGERTNAMTHDPLCDWRPCTCPLDYDVPQRGHRISCPEYDCECDIIAKVRADERKKPE